MRLITIRTLRGPNRWSKKTAIEVDVEVSFIEAQNFATSELQLKAWLPAAFDGTVPMNGTTSSRAFPDDSAPARMLERVCYALLFTAGVETPFHRTSKLPRPGGYRVIFEYREEAVARSAVEEALQLINRAAEPGAICDVGAIVGRLRSMDESVRLGPSTGSIVKAAETRGIPTRRLNEGSLVQLGWGARQHRILAAETTRTSSIAEAIAQDKELTKSLLRSAGVPVPAGRSVESAEDAWAAAQELAGPVVIKPQYGNQGRGVAVDLTTQEQIDAAYAAARKEGSSIVVERYHPGRDHRVLVVGDRMVAAARRDPPLVTGDGAQTIEALVEDVNRDPRRGEDHATALSKLRLDAIALGVLEEQGLTPVSIPAAGRVVVLRRNANLSTGGSAMDVTDQVHPEVAARAIEAARVVGLDIAGVDVVCADIRRPLEEQAGVIVEVNAAPGLRMHLDPSEGRPRPVGEAIVGLMFAPGDTGRVPLVAVTGTNGKTTTTRLVGHIFASQGKRVGMTTSDGIYIEGRRIDVGDCSGPKSARSVLMNPVIEAAALETARGGILREGLGWDRCDAAIVTNIGEGDHLGLNGIETVEELAAIKRVVVENVAPTGAAVLNAADPLTAAMGASCPGRVVYFARDASHPTIVQHRSRGGRAVFVRNDAIVLAEGSHEERLIALTDVPLTLGGSIGFQVENALAASAATWSTGVPLEAIRVGLATFINEPKKVPGRFNLLSYAAATIIVDYAHNVDACKAIIDAIRALPHGRRWIVFSGAGDRRNSDIERQAELLGDGFDTMILYEDACNRGRKDGEVLALLKRGATRGKRVSAVHETRGELRAIESALRAIQPGDLLVIQADQVDLALAFVERFIASHASPMPRGESTSASRPTATS